MDAAWMAVAALFLIGYVFLAILANFDLTDGRFALYMDERITFDGVQHILYPESFAAFVQSVIDGGDHRYGRALWNSMAAASFLPAYIFGDQGQIIASRMLQVALLIAAFIVLAQTFVKSWGLKALLLAALLALPYTDYYMTMPKPEPLQLFFLALFLFFHKKTNLAFGAHWVFMGLAFGTKISTLPAMAVFVAFSILAHRIGQAAGDLKIQLVRTAIFFSLGFGLAVPILLMPIVAAILVLYLLKWAGGFMKLSKGGLLLASLAAMIFLLIGARHQLKTWLSATFLNTGHGADQESINFISWAEYFLSSWLVAPSWIGGALITCAGIFLAFWLGRVYRQEDRQLPIGLVVALAGLALNLAIFAGVQRLWGCYLFPGSVLLLTGLFCLVNSSLVPATSGRRQPTSVLELFLASGLAVIVTLMAFVYWAPDGIAKFKELRGRTGRTEYKIEFESYDQVRSSLSRLSQSKNKILNVAFDPILFIPPSNSRYKLVEFWGPYVDWNKNADVLIFSSVHTPWGRDCLAGSAPHQACLAERDGYSKFVITQGASCKQEKCYRLHAELPNGGEILVLESAN